MSSQPTRQIVLDTETTGLYHKSGDKVVEIGCVEIINRKLTGSTFQQYINPERKSSDRALVVHGLEQKFLQTKPVFKDIAEQFINYVRGANLVMHNAPFDIGFLNHELSLLATPIKLQDICTVTDTLALASKIYPGAKNNLDALCSRLEIDNSHRQSHGALLDSQILAEVYLQMTVVQTTLSLNLAKPKVVLDDFYRIAQNLPHIVASDEELATHNKFINQYCRD